MASRSVASLFALLLLTATVGNAHADVTDASSERQLSLPSATTKLVLPPGDWVITQERLLKAISIK